MKTYIINPDNNKLVTIDDWRKEADPTRAQLLAVETDDDHLLVMSKSFLPGEFTFDQAQEAAAAFRPMEGIVFRCPTRKECIDLYDARFKGGLDEAVKLTGGEFGKPGRWFWTCERDADPNYAGNAWIFSGDSGFLNFIYVSTANRCQAVTLLK